MSRTGGRRRLRCYAAVAVLLGAGVGVAPAGAATGLRHDEAHQAPSGASDRLPVLATVAQRANADPQLIRFPVPAGVVPARVSGRLAFDSGDAGVVTVIAHGQQAARIDKPAGLTRRHVSFPVSGADVVNGYLQFSLKYTTTSAAGDRICINSDDGSAQLTHIVVTYAGQEQAPTTLAQFFGRSVTDVSIVTPKAPGSDVQAAALAASAAIAHRYSRGVHVTVTTPDDAARAATVDRTGGRRVMLTPGTGPVTASIGAAGGVQTLTLSGDPSRLAAAAAALGSPLISLADVAAAAPLSSTGHRATRTSLTLADLGQPSPTVQGIGQSEFTVPVRQSDFGTSVRSATLHLVGEHTAVPDSISAMVQYLWNGRLVASRVLNRGTTKVDEKISIPSSDIQADNTLTVQLNAIPTKIADGSGTFPPGFGCSGTTSTLPISLSLDGGASTVTIQAGHTGDPAFSRFPQVLGNVLTVALGDDSADTLTDAAALISELQFANTAQLAVRLVDPRSFIDSSAPGLLAGATAAQLNQLHAPLRMGSFRSIDQDDVHFGAGVDAPFAALEAWYQNGRDLLTLSSWSPTAPGTAAPIAAHLVTSLADSPYGWSALYDNVDVAQSTTAPPVLISSNAIVPQAEQLHQFNSYIYWVAGFVGIVVLMYLTQLVARRRLRRRAAVLVAAQQANDADHSAADADAQEPPGR